MEEKLSELTGRGYPINDRGWPASGSKRNWLDFCKEIHEANSRLSLRQMQKGANLSASRIGELLRGDLPVNEQQARDLLSALGATDSEIKKGIRRYDAAARAERAGAAGDAGPSAWWLRSGYAEQVRDIAPRHLKEREDELDELARWCAAGDEAYAWWQAGPKAGKTALMAWFVLHPPPGVTVISFFVSANRGDSDKFTGGLLRQLAAITGDQIPASASAEEQDSLRRELLGKAAARAGRRLVLVVDGLDEDRGSMPGSRPLSIAACLPKNPPPGVRVIVASRPDPPLPEDLQDDHPLLLGHPHCRIRPLSVSPHATYTTRVAKRELNEALANRQDRPGDLRYRIVGLIAACGDGLGHRDLQQLTSKPAGDVDLLLNSVFGRIIAGSADPQSGERVFLFTHETLREHAIGYLGADETARFAESLHTWAAGYQRNGWQADTPAYLLRGYPRMLADADDTGRLVALATDPARHQRMLDATGGDAAALAEITAAAALISISHSPDLLAALRLAWHRDELADRNAHIPAQLPAVWEVLGQPVHAEALARSITSPSEQGQALAGVAMAAARAGDYHRAEQVARSITSPSEQGQALAGVAMAAARAGDYHRAERLAQPVTRRPLQEKQEQLVTDIVAAITHGLAEQIAQSAADPSRQAEVAAESGDYGLAERLARSIADPSRKAQALAIVAAVAAGAGDHDLARALAADAERLARSIADPSRNMRALAIVAAVAAGAGDYGLAERLARSITDPSLGALALAYVAAAAAEADGHDRVRALAADAMRLARSITNQVLKAQALTRVAEVVAGAGDYGLAKRLIRPITDPSLKAQALTRVAVVAAGAGDDDQAWALAAGAQWLARRSITSPFERARALAQLPAVVAGVGDHDQAEQLAQHSVDPDVRAQALADVAAVVAGAGDYGLAERLTQSITDPSLKVQALTRVAAVAARAGDHDLARALAADAQPLAWSITCPSERARALASLASVAEPARARTCIAGALAAGQWMIPLDALACIDPAALSAFADELMTTAVQSTGDLSYSDGSYSC